MFSGLKSQAGGDDSPGDRPALSVFNPGWALARGRGTGYALATIFTALAALVRWALPELLAGTPYLAFYPAVVAAAGLCGKGPGMLATVGSLLCVDLLFDSTPGYFDFTDPVVLGRAAIFLAGGIGISIVAGMQRAAQARQRKQAEELLEVVQLLDLANVLVRDMDDRIVRWNAGCRRLYGFTAEQAIGQVSHDLFRTRFPQPLETIRAALMKTGRWEGESVHTAADGRDIVVASEWVLSRNALGQASAILEVNTDISHRKHAEAALRRSEDRYRGIVEASAAAVWSADTDGRMIDDSPSWRQFTGQTLEDFLGYGWLQAIHPEDRSRAEADWRTALEQGVPYETEYRVWRNSSGSYRHTMARGVRVLNDDGSTREWVGMNIDITELRQSEAEQARLAAIVETSHDAILSKNLDGIIQTWNAAAERVFGYRAEEMIGQPLSLLFPPERRGEMDSIFSRLRAGERIEDHETVRMAKDGRRLDVSVTIAPIRDHAGQIIGASTITRDISARKAMEESLRQSEQRFRSFLEATTQVQWFTNPRGEVDMAIPAWQAYTGQTEEQARGFGWMDAIREEDRPRVAEAWKKAFETSGLYEVEYLLRIHDGSWRNALARGVPVRNPDGTVREYIGVCIDITAQKQAEESLRESELFFRQMLESIPGMVFTTRPDGYCDYQSQQWADYTGVPMSEHLGDGWNKLLHPDDRPRAYAAWRAAVEERASYDLEYRVRRHDGQYEWFKVIGRPIRDAAGQIVRWFGVALNIEALKQAEEDLRAARDSAEHAKAAAEHANRAKDHFLAVLSHELRTPLTPVVMGVSMLQDLDLDPQVRETLEMVRRNVEMEARLIDDLLDVTRIARGKIELQKQRVPLCTIIQRAVEVCKPDIEARQLHFGVDIGPAAPYWIEADASRLQQVFWNLLKNAIKFTPHGGCVGIRCRPNETHIVAEVNDSGIGMEPDALSRVFNAFEQAERSITRQFGGLGLGLAISKALVEMHGGTIEAHSEGRDKGATFRIRLPLTAPAGKPEALAPAVPPQQVARPLHILLVEDHGVTAKMMRMMLSAAGHTVETAGDVATALELAERHAFDLLLSDLGLPDGSGHDLMRELRKRGHNFPGIALSGYGQESDIQRSCEAGFASHLTKPASREAVVEAVAGVVASRERAGGRSVSDPQPETPLFDADEALQRCGDVEMLHEMVESFLCEVDVLFPQLRAALSKGNLEEVGRLGHRMKGTVVYLGAKPAKQAALRVEQFGRSSDGGLPEAEKAVNELERACEALKAALAAHRLWPNETHGG